LKKYIIYAGIILFTSCQTSKESIPNQEIIRYERSIQLADVLDKARDSKKIVLLDVYTDWCLPCKMMDREVYSDKATADFMNKNFINYKVNAEKNEGPDLSLIYSVDAYPTILFLDYRGRVVKRHVGGLGLQKFNELMEEVLGMPKDWM
jgi:thiol:disulfide interchange protein